MDFLVAIIAGRKAEVRMLTDKVTGLFRTVVSLYRYLYRKFKPPFFWPEPYRRTGELSISFLSDENPNVCFGWLGR
jgi:hypothetical protein